MVSEHGDETLAIVDENQPVVYQSSPTEAAATAANAAHTVVVQAAVDHYLQTTLSFLLGQSTSQLTAAARNPPKLPYPSIGLPDPIRPSGLLLSASPPNPAHAGSHSTAVFTPALHYPSASIIQQRQPMLSVALPSMTLYLRAGVISSADSLHSGQQPSLPDRKRTFETGKSSFSHSGQQPAFSASNGASRSMGLSPTVVQQQLASLQQQIVALGAALGPATNLQPNFANSDLSSSLSMYSKNPITTFPTLSITNVMFGSIGIFAVSLQERN